MVQEGSRDDGSAEETPAARFLRSAKLCHTRDLKQVAILSDLVKDISELIHALQKERGASSIFLGSNGSQFAERLAQRTEECRGLEQAMRERLEHVDERLDRMSSGASFYTRAALAFHALDTLPSTREQIASLTMAPQDAVKAFTEIIGSLLAVVFETADIAADPTISRALVALVNFAQGKEFAGQERATAGAGFSRGHFHATERRRLQRIVAAQDQSFRIFFEFADAAQVAIFRRVLTSRDSLEVERMRKIAFAGGRIGEVEGVGAEAWFEQTTRRIDAMKGVEEQLAVDLKQLCAVKLAEAEADSKLNDMSNQDAVPATVPVAMLVMDVDPGLNDGLDSGVGLYTLSGMKPKPMRSILDVVQAQSRRLHDVSHELESARTALNERKTIERAKGLLMTNRRISEQESYALLRKTAMDQNKRIIEVAEAVVGMAEILKP